jgi:putative membrane protein
VPRPLIFFTRLDVESISSHSSRPCSPHRTDPAAPRAPLVPARIKRLHASARETFLVQNLHTTVGHTGVLIFVSVAERQVEILADTAIDARVARGTWTTIVEELTSAIGKGRPADGLVAAIAAVGGHLARHFPPDTRHADELPNHLIILP